MNKTVYLMILLCLCIVKDAKITTKAEETRDKLRMEQKNAQEGMNKQHEWNFVRDDEEEEDENREDVKSKEWNDFWKNKEGFELNRDLKKTKSGKGYYHYKYKYDDDDKYDDDYDDWFDDDEYKNSKSGKYDDDDDDWFDDDDDYYYDKHGKSGKGRSKGGRRNSKSNKGSKSNKQGKSGKDSSKGSSKGGSGKGGGGNRRGECNVSITNLSFQQSFGDLFVMVHNKQVQRDKPLFVYGNRSSEALASLAQDLSTTQLVNAYEGRSGVSQVMTISDFGNTNINSNNKKYLPGGSQTNFTVRFNSTFNRITLAAGFPFANDGIVALQGGIIYDGAEYFLKGVDAGVEANIATCWSVPAQKDDFPPNSDCATSNQISDALGDLNENDIPGEGFVHVHRGMSDLDVDDDVQDLLLPSCNFVQSQTQRFVEYFREINYDDDFLLCQSGSGRGCLDRDDDDFIAIVDQNEEFDTFLFSLVRSSTSFDEFCEEVNTINDDLQDIFVFLEPTIFDFRDPMAKLSIQCKRH